MGDFFRAVDRLLDRRAGRQGLPLLDLVFQNGRADVDRMGYQRIVTTCLAFAIAAANVAPAAAAGTFSSTGQYARVLRTFNPRLTHAQSGELAAHVKSEAQFYRLDARLLVALVAIESSWHPYATSPVGAGGLGQLMPGTAAGLGVRAYSPFENLNGTARYLRGLLDRFSAYDQKTRYEYALAGYNAGPYAVQRYGGIPPYSETRNYVRNVMGIWRQLSVSLSSHIDDAAVATAPAPKRLAALPRTVAKRHIGDKRAAPVLVADVSTLPAQSPPPAALQKKPFLYYFFHHGHKDAGEIAEAADGMGPDPAAIDGTGKALAHHARGAIALVAPGSVGGGRPIHVRLKTATISPVTFVVRVGPTVIAQATLPAHAKSLILKGIPGADLERIVVLYAYAQGYDEGHVAIMVLPKSSAVAAR